MVSVRDLVIVIKGSGELASGVAHRLYQSGFRPVMTELPGPLVVRRTVSFAEAVFAGETRVEGVPAVLAGSPEEAGAIRRRGVIPVVVDPGGKTVETLKPDVLVDATMAKRNTGIRITDAPVVIALGPGFKAGEDVHAVVETKRGHYLGRVIWAGPAIPDTGEPDPVNGHTHDRVVRAPAAGVFAAARNIGDRVEAGDTLGFVGGHPVKALIGGVLRGLIRDGSTVGRGLKIGDVDPRGVKEHCYSISDKARAVAGGVLEAIMHLLFFAQDGRTGWVRCP
ncbi:MAG: EF2563 family selenium-dependent molybdenum hydroxylase system protein [Peptococcaceae bacterium]|nr:EF2563 family selenium-dependent molybdenum hydroxylase system protein [Peptococcaceae bacterium]